MGETFYTILRVDQDADSSAIRRAYRSQVKECHPDVSDDPDAGERFKRLTTARDTLLDPDERSAYDRLGHDAYVRQHVESAVWQPSPAATGSESTPAGDSDTGDLWSGSRSRSRSGSSGRHSTAESADRRQSDPREAGRSGGSAADNRSRTGEPHRRDRRRGRSRKQEDWQRASNAYRRTETGTVVRSSPLKAAFGAVGRLGPWLFIHLALVASALVTTWFMLDRPGTDPALAAATGLFSLLLVGVTLILSLVHLLTELS